MQAAVSDTHDFSFSDEQFAFLAGLANRLTGIVLTDNKKNMVYGRLVRRLRALGLTGFDAYCDLLRGPAGEAETGQLVNAVTTNLTRFFREPHHFEMLVEQLQALVAGGKRRLRIWSAGCSAGMEPYSIAMALTAAGIANGNDVKILATDIDTAMLGKAVEGLYGTDDVAPVPASCQQFLLGEPAGVRIADPIRQMVRFNRLNLLEDWPISGQFDAIFCRNVVIYFDKPTKEQLFSRMASRLTPDGLLYIGHSENLHGIASDFELAGRTAYRKVPA